MILYSLYIARNIFSAYQIYKNDLALIVDFDWILIELT